MNGCKIIGACRMIIIMLAAGILSFSCGLAGYADSLCTCTIMTYRYAKNILIHKSCFSFKS